MERARGEFPKASEKRDTRPEAAALGAGGESGRISGGAAW